MRTIGLGGCSLVAAILLVPTAPIAVWAQQEASSTGYVLPPESVRELFDRDKSFASLEGVSPDGSRVVVPYVRELSTLERMSRTTYRLAMLQLRPAVNREWALDTHGIDRLEILSLESRDSLEVVLPADTFVSDLMWSPDGQRLAFLAHRPERTEVWTAEAATGRAEPLADAAVMATLAGRRGFRQSATSSSRILQWTAEGNVVALLVPGDRGPEPTRSPVARGPIVRTTREKPTPTSTLRFLLQDEHDRALFRYYTTAQVAELSAAAAPRPIGAPGMFLGLSLSPGGRHLLTERIVEPLSDLVGYTSFPRRLEVMGLDGRVLSTVRDVPLNEDSSRRTAQLEADLPRDVVWRPDGTGLGFLWREPTPESSESDADDDDAEEGEPRRDRIMQLEAPFDLTTASTVTALDAGARFQDVAYALDGAYAFATVRNSGTGGGTGGKTTERIVAYDLARGGTPARVLVDDHDPDDVVGLPGAILTRTTGNGLEYALVSGAGDAAYLQGPGYRDDYRPRPFVDRVAIATGEAERVFEGASDMFEQPIAALDPDLGRMLVSRESTSAFPDTFMWSRDGAMTRVTRNRDPFPEITAARRVDFRFTRQDGVEVRARISLPVGYQEGTRVPAIFWTYPREYASAEAYEKAAIRSRNEHAFTHLSYLRWSDVWLTQGYALVYPDVPIIRKSGTANDNYIPHLVDSLYGAIREVDRLGYVDIDRIGHGGHSYGAFATANLLANTPFFKAGIGGDGAYNRSLTPMGFQSERRHLWEAPDVYLEMSPFFNADHIDTPLLMYHGQDDNNSGTFPIQSERLMQVLTGLGKTAALYVYPYESHGPRAKASYLDLWARWLEWFDLYVKQLPEVESSLP